MRRCFKAASATGVSIPAALTRRDRDAAHFEDRTAYARIVAIIEGISLWSARISAVVLGLMTLLILVEILLWNTLEKTTLIADEYCAYGWRPSSSGAPVTA